MSDDAPANTPTWLRWAVPALLLAVAVLLVIADRAQWRSDWINVAAQLALVALAVLLFWYVLETLRVAKKTGRPLTSVSLPLVFREFTREEALFPGPFERWCGRGDSNPHALSGTRF
jgi:cytochrome bd-type quinol oxidase subunit 2